MARRHHQARRKDKLKPPYHPCDEPVLEGEDWIEWGGELVWAVDFTPGGAPIGLSEMEFRRLDAEAGAAAGWARAKILLAWAFGACSPPGAGVQVGRVTKVGDGLSREAYAAHVDLQPDPERLAGVWCALLPGKESSPEDWDRWVREIWILGQLASEELSFRVPAALGAFPGSDGPTAIRSFMEGVPADLRAGRMPSIRPAELIGKLASAIHSVDVSTWGRLPPGGSTRRAHGQQMLRSFDDLGSEADFARHWASEHLPDESPATLVHGDLLGQNILLSTEQNPAVIDWEYCRLGDPAYDLAIATRGARQPFQMGRGLERLLDAYAEAGGEPIAARRVHFYELCLSASWYRAALDGAGNEPPDQALARIHRILQRAERA